MITTLAIIKTISIASVWILAYYCVQSPGVSYVTLTCVTYVTLKCVTYEVNCRNFIFTPVIHAVGMKSGLVSRQYGCQCDARGRGTLIFFQFRRCKSCLSSAFERASLDMSVNTTHSAMCTACCWCVTLRKAHETYSQMSKYFLWKCVFCVPKLCIFSSTTGCPAGKYGPNCIDCPAACKDKTCEKTSGNCIGNVLSMYVKVL